MHKSWTFNASLPGTEIRALLQTPDGFIWLGTDAGLVQFDGLNLTVFNQTNTPAISDDRVNTMAITPDGSLWVGTEDGLLRLKDRIVTRYTEKDGLTSNQIRSLARDENGTLWVKAGVPNDWRFKFSQWVNGKFVPAPRSELFPRLFMRTSRQCFGQTMLQGRNGDTWEISYPTHRLSVLKNGEEARYGAENGLSSSVVKLLFEDKEGTIWIKTDKGVDRFIHGRFLHYRLRPSDPQPEVTCAQGDKYGDVWFVTRGNDVFLWTSQGVSHESFLGEVRGGIFNDRDNNHWFITSSGLELLQEGSVTSYGRPEGITDQYTLSLMADQDGAVWVGTLTGKVYRLSSQGVTGYQGLARASVEVRAGQSYIGRAILSIYQTQDKRIWVSTVNGLKALERGKLIALPSVTRSIPEKVETMYEDSERVFWIGTDRGLVRLKNGEYTRFANAPGTAVDAVSAITGSADGGLWIGTSGGGLRHFDGNAFRTYTTTDGLSHNLITAVFQSGDGTLWIGTPRGLNSFKDGKFTKYSTSANHSLDNHICAILADDDNHLWISSAEGIISISAIELEAFATGKSESWNYFRYGSEDGLRSKACSQGTQASAVKDRHGTLWFATNAGIVRIDPMKAWQRSPDLQVFIESVSANFIPIDPVHGGSVPPGKNDLEFHYTAPSFRDPDRIQFRYRLAGFDQNWVSAATRRSAFYTNMPPGKYTFQVQARNVNGGWSELGASVEINLRPHIYQMLWFHLILLLSLISATVWFYLMRKRQLAAQMQQRLEERLADRTRIAQELHDTFLQDVVGLVFNIELASSELPSRPGDAKGRLQGVLDQLRRIVASGRRALTDLRSPNISYGDLAKALLRLGEQLRTEDGPELDISVEGNVSWLPPLIGDEVFQVSREALFNAVRHAQASTIKLFLNCTEHELRLRIVDDGCGIPPEILRRGRDGHFGLQGMRERAARINAHFTCHSLQGTGTAVALCVGLPTSNTMGRLPRLIASVQNWFLKRVRRGGLKTIFR